MSLVNSPAHQRRREQERAHGRLNVAVSRGVAARRAEAAAYRVYAERCAELIAGAGSPSAVAEAEAAVAVARRDVERAEAAAAYWRVRAPGRLSVG